MTEESETHTNEKTKSALYDCLTHTLGIALWVFNDRSRDLKSLYKPRRLIGYLLFGIHDVALGLPPNECPFCLLYDVLIDSLVCDIPFVVHRSVKVGLIRVALERYVHSRDRFILPFALKSFEWIFEEPEEISLIPGLKIFIDRIGKTFVLNRVELGYYRLNLVSLDITTIRQACIVLLRILIERITGIPYFPLCESTYKEILVINRPDNEQEVIKGIEDYIKILKGLKS